MNTTVTVNFPKPVYRHLKQQARVLQRPIDDIVVQTVTRRLPLWFDIMPLDFENEVAQLDNSSVSQLMKFAKRKLAIAKQRKLDALLQKNGEGTLTSKELVELDHLQLEANLLMLKKAKALALLKNKGYDLPVSEPGKAER